LEDLSYCCSQEVRYCDVGATVAWETIAWEARLIKVTMDIEENMKQLVGIELNSDQEKKVLLERKKIKRREEIE
jgi:hypothetical protein